jgi:hypothetical protein
MCCTSASKKNFKRKANSGVIGSAYSGKNPRYILWLRTQ